VSNPKNPTAGGSGGKRGHSNMEHWGYTAEVKEAARTRRRQDDVREAQLEPGGNPDYSVRIYCHDSWRNGKCAHSPSHPHVLPRSFASIRAANDHGSKEVAAAEDQTIEWEVLDSSGEPVC
jgi:hypothetical protein